MCRWTWLKLFSVMSLVVFLVSAVACSSGEETGGGAASSAAATESQAQAPEASGGEPLITRLVITNPAPNVESNNTQLDLNPPAGIQLKPMYESLIGYDPDTGALIPQLATSWSIEPGDGGAVAIRFKLQEGVRFHGDNGEFTAKDVAFSHSQHAREDATHPHAAQYRRVTVEEVNDYEVVLHLDQPNAELIRLISELNMSSMDISSAVDFAKIGEPTLVTRAPAGTGVYQFAERRQGEFVRFERVPYQHWRVTADFPELEFRWIQEASTRLAGLLTDESHITQLPEDQMQEATSRGMMIAQGTIAAQRVFLGFRGVYLDQGYQFYEKQNTSCGYVYCDSPFLDLRVRKAMNKALDKNELNRAFFGGKGQTMYMNHLSPIGPYFNPEWQRNYPQEYGYDPQAARDLLAEAGYGPNNPLEINVQVQVLAQFTQSADVLEAAAGYWRDVGIKANLLTIDPAELRANGRALAYKNDVNFHGTPDFDIQGWRVRNSHVSPRGSGLELRETGEIVDRLRATMDTEEQNRIMRELGNVAYPLHTSMFLFWLPAELVINPKYVESYKFPGSPPGIYTHFERIKAVKR